jgi:L-rhamnose mutarotase
VQYVGNVYRVRAGMRAEYARRHKSVWPELDALLRRAGVRSFAIYAWGDVIFSHMEVEDLDRMMKVYGEDPVGARWEQEMAELLEYPNADPETGWPEGLTKIWSLD